jgi:hypothetical protein
MGAKNVSARKESAEVSPSRTHLDALTRPALRMSQVDLSQDVRVPGIRLLSTTRDGTVSTEEGRVVVLGEGRELLGGDGSAGAGGQVGSIDGDRSSNKAYRPDPLSRFNERVRQRVGRERAEPVSSALVSGGSPRLPRRRGYPQQSL